MNIKVNFQILHGYAQMMIERANCGKTTWIFLRRCAFSSAGIASTQRLPV